MEDHKEDGVRVVSGKQDSSVSPQGGGCLEAGYRIGWNLGRRRALEIGRPAE